jgi:hypothetical protein
MGHESPRRRLKQKKQSGKVIVSSPPATRPTRPPTSYINPFRLHEAKAPKLRLLRPEETFWASLDDNFPSLGIKRKNKFYYCRTMKGDNNIPNKSETPRKQAGERSRLRVVSRLSSLPSSGSMLFRDRKFRLSFLTWTFYCSPLCAQPAWRI